MFQYWPVQYYAQRALTQGTPEYTDLQRRLYEMARRQLYGNHSLPSAQQAPGIGLTSQPQAADQLPTGYRWNWPDWYSPRDIAKVKKKYSDKSRTPIADMIAEGIYIVPLR